MNHASGKHGFDGRDDNPRTREILLRVVHFISWTHARLAGRLSPLPHAGRPCQVKDDSGIRASNLASPGESAVSPVLESSSLYRPFRRI